MATAAEMHSILVGEVEGAQELRNKVQMTIGMLVNDISTGVDLVNPPFDQTNKGRERRLLFTARLFFDDFLATFFSVVIAWARHRTMADILALSDDDIYAAMAQSIDGMAQAFEVAVESKAI